MTWIILPGNSSTKEKESGEKTAAAETGRKNTGSGIWKKTNKMIMMMNTKHTPEEFFILL